MGLLVGLAGFYSVELPASACTIFVLTDKDRALFCNNEDWSNPNTRIWFNHSPRSTNVSETNRPKDFTAC